MPKRILRNALLMMVATFLMALGLLTYIHSTGSLPGGENPGSKLDKARELGIKIINEEEFFSLLPADGSAE